VPRQRKRRESQSILDQVGHSSPWVLSFAFPFISQYLSIKLSLFKLKTRTRTHREEEEKEEEEEEEKEEEEGRRVIITKSTRGLRSFLPSFLEYIYLSFSKN
jgi:hypothetical protein